MATTTYSAATRGEELLFIPVWPESPQETPQASSDDDSDNASETVTEIYQRRVDQIQSRRQRIRTAIRSDAGAAEPPLQLKKSTRNAARTRDIFEAQESLMPWRAAPSLAAESAEDTEVAQSTCTDLILLKKGESLWERSGNNNKNFYSLTLAHGRDSSSTMSVPLFPKGESG
jgi:hypothetical protein